MLSLFEEALKDTKKDITEIRKILTNPLNHEHKAINKKRDQIFKSLKN